VVGPYSAYVRIHKCLAIELAYVAGSVPTISWRTLLKCLDRVPGCPQQEDVRGTSHSRAPYYRGGCSERSRTSGDPRDLNGRKPPPCQRDGRITAAGLYRSAYSSHPLRMLRLGPPARPNRGQRAPASAVCMPMAPFA
jgi:hypothetical protein